ncbi:hypothetical protein CE154_006525 [Alicycliphilus denitrificans]|uniref:Uncharacterized protein n=1 Tax=Alicycliphilus denitrificans TaxID=179636 RepID=A0A3R7EGR7_9BURK|nr:hypothetical protein CE154_006525 [Alicycliphilus denitrificans]
MWLAGICARQRSPFLLLRQKKGTKEKTTLLSVSLRFAAGNLRCSKPGCAAELTARWRAPFGQPQRVSSRSMGAATPMPPRLLRSSARPEGNPRYGPSLRSAPLSRRVAPARSRPSAAMARVAVHPLLYAPAAQRRGRRQ